MKTQTRVHVVLVSVLLAVGWLLPVQAMDEIAIAPKAYGIASATLICEKTPEGLKAFDTVLLSHLHIDHIDAANIQRGVPCLWALTQYPPLFATLRFIAQLYGNGTDTDTTIGESLIWMLVDPNESVDISRGHRGFIDGDMLFACDAGEEGLETAVIETLDGTFDTSPYIGQSCGKTLTELSINRSQVSGPYAAALGVDAAHNPTGGLAFLMANEGAIVYVECNLNPQTNKLGVTYMESSDSGVAPDAVDTSCLAALAAIEEKGGRFTTSGPTPIPQGETGRRQAAFFLHDVGVVTLD